MRGGAIFSASLYLSVYDTCKQYFSNYSDASILAPGYTSIILHTECCDLYGVPSGDRRVSPLLDLKLGESQAVRVVVLCCCTTTEYYIIQRKKSCSVVYDPLPLAYLPLAARGLYLCVCVW